MPGIPIFVLLAALPCGAAAAPQPAPRLGMNLSGPAGWNGELPFVDVFRLSRSWISQRTGAAWGKGPALDLDPRGWVKRLEPDCWAEKKTCEKHFDGWTAEGGDVFCYFTSEPTWSKWGSWGILGHYDEDPAESSKFMAAMRWAQRCGQPIRLPR